MRRLLTASVLFTLALLATAAGQPQPPDPGGQIPLPKKGADEKQPPGEKIVIITPTEAAIAAALANDPDVRMAKAKIQLAEAELAKARQAVTLKVVALKAKIDQLKVDLRAAEDRLAWVTAMVQKAAIQQSELLAARDRLDAAKGALALAETEWKLLTGSAFGGPVADLIEPNATAMGLAWLAAHGQSDQTAARLARYLAAMEAAQKLAAVKGPVPDRIRAALDKPVKLAEKGHSIQFHEVVEAFKKAGFDVPIRQNQKAGFALLMSQGEELPIGAWLQLFLDSTPGTVMVVREYGILVVDKANAPPDAPSVIDFWKQKAPTKEAEPKK